MGDSVTRAVALDTSVLINFLVLKRLDLLAVLPGYVFHVPEDVVAGVRRARMRATLASYEGAATPGRAGR